MSIETYGVAIRSLTAADASAFQALRLQGLAECPAAFASSYEEECRRSLKDVAARLQTERGFVLGAFAELRLVGILGFMRDHHTKLAHKAWLWGMYVEPDSRSRGIGRDLVNEALMRARQISGLRQVYLGVNAANIAALSLYQSMGFVQFGREPACMIINGEPHDEIHMVCMLSG